MTATSMLVADIWDEMCWRHFSDIGDGFGCFTISKFCHRHPKPDTNIKWLTYSHKHPLVTNIHVATDKNSKEGQNLYFYEVNFDQNENLKNKSVINF